MGLDMYLMKAEDVFCWRKANHIHKWFVDNVQDGEDNCGLYYVNRADLEKLLAVVNQVLENPNMAKKLLPTQDGFFFGGTQYDEYYFADLKDTKEIIEKELANKANKDATWIYHSSW